MNDRSTSSSQREVRTAVARAALLSCALVSGCASLGGMRRDDAVSSAVQGVCGARASDSTCTVRSVERIDRGYRVVVDRRPPTGRDRVAVEVRSRLFGGRSIEVLPLDSASAR